MRGTHPHHDIAFLLGDGSPTPSPSGEAETAPNLLLIGLRVDKPRREPGLPVSAAAAVPPRGDIAVPRAGDCGGCGSLRRPQPTATPAGRGRASCRGPCELRGSVEEAPQRGALAPHPPLVPRSAPAGAAWPCDSRRLDPIRSLRGSFLHHPGRRGVSVSLVDLKAAEYLLVTRFPLLSRLSVCCVCRPVASVSHLPGGPVAWPWP